MNTTANIINFPKILFRISNSLVRQKVFLKKHINPILEKYATSELTESDISKIKKYYGLAVPAILGNGFCILRGKPLTQKENLALTYVGSLTGIYDDFFDKLNTQENHILELTTSPSEKLAKNDHESLFIKLYRLALANSPSKELLKEKFILVYDAQLQSTLQKNSNLSIDELRKITFLKGGVSILFYRCVLNEIADKREETLIFNLGSLMQLENDIFDIFKDYQENISTLATIAFKIGDLRETYVELHHKVIQSLKETKFPKKNKIFFARYINLIICRGYVCLDFLAQNEKLTNGIFSIKDYSRKQLICDMEKPRNMIKAFNYYANSSVSILK